MAVSSKGKKKDNRRLFEVDSVKFLAIIFMVCVHVYEQFGKWDFYGDIPGSAYRNTLEFLGGPLAAPVFMFCMGVGMIYTRHSEPADFIRRGVKLLLTGYALNFVRQTLPMLIGMMIGIKTDYSLIGGLLNVDILPFAGMTFITVGILKKINAATPVICGIAVLMQAVGIWGTKLKIASVGVQTLLGLLLPSGQHVAFPLTLWLIYPAFGMLFGEWLKKTEDRDKLYRRMMLSAASFFAAYTAALLYIGYDIRMFYALYDLTYYHQTILSTLWIMPLVILELGACYFLLRKIEETKGGAFIRYCSINLNTIYIIQWILIAYTLAFSMLFGVEKTQSPLKLTALGFLMLAAAIGIMTLIRKIECMKQQRRENGKEKIG